MNQIYSFVRNDILNNKNNYFYSTFKGNEFLQAWYENRQAVLNKSNKKDNTNKNSINCSTEELLKLFKIELLNNRIDNVIDSFDLLLQRFEVTKRIYAYYDKNYRPIDINDYHRLECYISFGEVLNLIYLKTGNIKYLNTLLKCLDILISLQKDLNTEQDSKLKELIKQEIFHIEKLQKEFGL